MMVSEEIVALRLQVLDRLIAVAGASKEPCRVLGDALQTLVDGLPGVCGGAYRVFETLGIVPAVGAAGESGAELEALLAVRLAHADGQDLYGEPQVVTDGAFAAGGTAVIIPLKAVNKTVGHMALAFVGAASVSGAEGDVYRAAGRVVGLTVDNLRLYEDVNRRLRRSNALHKVSRAFGSTLDLDRLLSMIVSYAVDTIPDADNGVLHLLDERTGELRPRSLSFQPGVLPDMAGGSGMHLGEGAAGLALEQGTVVNIGDVAADARFVPWPGARRLVSLAVAPLMIEERRIGTLSIDSQESDAFSKDDEQLLLTLATMAAAAIDNARLVSDLQRSLEHLNATQARLIQSAKLSAVGRLISGVAHELNNPLTAVMGYVQLLQMAPDLGAEMARDLDKIQSQAHRAAEIVQNLLTFARQSQQEERRVDLIPLIRHTVHLNAYAFRKANIEVHVDLREASLDVYAAPDQIQQVFLELMRNAQDALSTMACERRLTISASRADDCVRVSFTDNGPGLSPQAREHLFEPFFTTKEVGEGTGLGLAICFGIVSKYGGQIMALEPNGPGATFVVELPAAQVRQTRAQRAEGDEPAPVGERQPCRVLVVDDEPDVAAFLEAMLTDAGHHAVRVSDGGEALRYLAGTAGRDDAIDAVISDVNMPGLSAPAMYQRLCREHPYLARRVLFITGGLLDSVTNDFLQANHLLHLEKPFSLQDLDRALARLLGREPSASS